MITRTSSCDFYPRPPRGGRPAQLARASAAEAISIHALREEGDRCRTRQRSRRPYFYPRPPRGGRLLRQANELCEVNFYPRPPRGGRPSDAPPRDSCAPFLSTPSARRATLPDSTVAVTLLISIHALREEGDKRRFWQSATLQISIHALREEGDYCTACLKVVRKKFLSTPSARRATQMPATGKGGHTISIHALREEGDKGGKNMTVLERLFLSTPSARRATYAGLHGGNIC